MSHEPGSGNALRAASADPPRAGHGAAGAAAAAPAAGIRARSAALGARVLPVAVPAAVMLALGLWGLVRQSSMGNDEVATRVAALLSIRQLLFLLRHVDAVHGLYYLLMHAWVAFGSSPAVLRVPSVIAMAVAVALISVLARRLTGSGWAGLCAGLVMALTPVISFYAQTARSYAMVVACVLGSTLALLAALAAEERAASAAAAGPGKLVLRPWLLYGALTAAEGYLNEMALLVLAAQAVTVLLGRFPREVLRRWAATAAGACVLVGPLALLSAKEDGAIGWIPPPGLADLEALAKNYFGATIPALAIVVGCGIIALLPDRYPGPTGRPSRSGAPWWRSGGVTVPSVALPLLILPALLLLLESVVTKPLYTDRYVLYGEAGAALLAGAGMYRIGRWLRDVPSLSVLAWVPAAAACIGLLLFQLGPQRYVRTPQSRLYDFGGPARYVGAHARRGDAVLFFNNFFRKARLGYPGDFAKTSDIGQALSPRAAGTFRGTDLAFGALRPLMLERSRIWVIGFAPSPSLPAGLLRQQSLLLGHRFALVSERHFKGVVVTLWTRRMVK